MKLSIGGWKAGYVNVDLYDKRADYMRPIWDTGLDDSAYDWIEAIHVLEHCPYQQVVPALKEIGRLLTPSGSAAVMVPDLSRAFRMQLEKPCWPPFAAIYGNQKNEGQFHHTCFSPETLATVISQNAGLRLVSIETIDYNADRTAIERITRIGNPTPDFTRLTARIRIGILAHIKKLSRT